MKKVVSLLGVLVLLMGCKDAAVEKPEKLIDEQTMADIVYDLAVFEAMKSKKPGAYTVSSSQYVYKKYNIDSLQFVQNNRYYASEVAKYQKIYNEVNARLESEKKVADSLAKVKGEKSDSRTTTNAPQIK